MSPVRHRGGFTLLEVTVAMAILALGLVAIVDLNAGATKLHEASQHITVATLLARSKLVDLEAKLNQDGFSDFDKEIDGTFDDEKHPEIKWKAEILKPDLTKSADQITGLVSGAMGGAGASGGLGGMAGGSSPLSALLGQSSLVPPGTTLPDSSSSSSAPSSPTTTGLGGVLGGAMTGRRTSWCSTPPAPESARGRQYRGVRVPAPARVPALRARLARLAPPRRWRPVR
jgi:prepilin-type N-terminal cleavage/methylation domain-containing protein